MPQRRNFDRQATTPKPQINCVCCGEPLHSYWQIGLIRTQPGQWNVECETNPVDCLMHMQTFTAQNYPPANLDTYLVYGEQRRAAILAHRPQENSA